MSGGNQQISLQPAVLRWARERAGFSQDELATKMRVKLARVQAWERSGTINIKHADRLAHCTYTPLGQLYLDKPREDTSRIPDFRAQGPRVRPTLTPNLLTTVETMLRRQNWMRDEVQAWGTEPLAYVGSCRMEDDPRRVAHALRDALQLTADWAAGTSTWTDALGHLRDRAEAAGALVVFNGIVGNNTFRKLDPDEFQGFALSDPYAPLVFVNNADFKAVQIFTLAHELAHLLIGRSGLTRFEGLQPAPYPTEQFCRQAAAEFLVPEARLRRYWPLSRQADDYFQSVACRFKVSSLVAAHRALDARLISEETYNRFYRSRKWQRRPTASHGGGSFWRNQRWRLGPRFGLAVARAAKEGRLLYREAYQLTDLSGEAFKQLPEKFGVRL